MTIPVGYGQAAMVVTSTAISGEAIITLGFANPDDHTAAEAAAAVGDAMRDAAIQGMTSDATVVECRVKLGPDDTGPSAVFALGSAGVASSDGPPAMTATLVRKITDLGGRKGRGRFFLPSPPENALGSDGRWGSGNVGDWNDDWAACKLAMEIAGFSPVLLHSDATTPTEIVSFEVDSRPGTQRRRNRR